MTHILFRQILLIVLISVLLGFGRQFAPHGLSWKGFWPSQHSGAEEAYRALALPTDPPFVSIAEALSLNRSDGAVFLDARTSSEYQIGHIPGARSLPFYEIEIFQDTALKNVSADDRLVVYCEGIGCELSLFLGRELTAAGYTNVSIFYGGYPAWVEEGLPIETGGVPIADLQGQKS